MIAYDEERAFYGIRGEKLSDILFAGPADGESALKETKDIELVGCDFRLRYPMWHCDTFTMENCVWSDTVRAGLWYSQNGRIKDCKMDGVKAVRECKNISIQNCEINSTEFGWKCDGIDLKKTGLAGEYAFLDSKNITLEDVEFSGKYSFQYTENVKIKNCVLDTKDAFWNSKNVTVENSKVKGEYLGWYSDGLTLINCEITGTQPLCCCTNLKLINCTMEGCDLSFEYSEVEADIRGHIDSVKNPLAGTIAAESVGELIAGSDARGCSGNVIIREA